MRIFHTGTYSGNIGNQILYGVAKQYYQEYIYDPASVSLTGTVYYYDINTNTEQTLPVINNIHSIYYDYTQNQLLRVTKYMNDGSISTASVSVSTGCYITKVNLTSVGSVNIYTAYLAISGNTYYADLAAGFHFQSTPETYVYGNGQQYPGLWPSVDLPDYSKEFTYTVNLDSITDPTYQLHFNIGPQYATGTFFDYYHLYPMDLEKTTVGGNTVWTLSNPNDSSSSPTQLYYDNTRNDNTYQFTISAENYYDESTGKYYINVNVKAAYVGGWPTLIGIANSYLDYDLDYVLRDDPNLISNTAYSLDDLSYSRLYFQGGSETRTPIMRVDDAIFRAFTYETIEDRTYAPASFRNNPVTTINDPQIYGESITFGGNTYTVSKEGTINLSGHDIPVKGLTLSSVPDGNGDYVNKIGNTVISTTATPSTIIFNGQWSASISTIAQESYTYSKTEWHAGSFGWDGIDQNFLMVGLITSLGVFVALGIYARKRGTGGIIPLMIVTGCAAAVFFIML